MAEVGAGAGRRPSVWGVLWFGGLLLAGLVLGLVSFGRLPPSQGALAVATASAPVTVTDELVRESSGRYGSGTYRKQNIAVAGGGRGYLVVSPPRTLWVPDLDRLDRGTTVRFLIDPGAATVYEARVGERVLLAYETSAGQRRRTALGGLAAALFLTGLGGFGLWREARYPGLRRPA